MKMFRHGIFPAASVVFAVFSAATAFAGDPAIEPPGNSRNDQPLDPNAQEMRGMAPALKDRGQILNASGFDRPQGLTLDEERLLQVQTELAISEHTIAFLQDRLATSVRAGEQVLLRKKLVEAEALHRRLEEDLRKQEATVEQCARSGAVD